jgi:hypothetical protein
MRSTALLLAAGLSLSLPAALAQNRPGPAYFLRHPATEPHLGLVLLPGGTLPAPLRLSLPTTGVPYAPLEMRTPTEAPRRDLTGPRAYPVYDPFQNLPETFRRNTLPEARIEPLAVQVLRSLLTP